MNSKGGQFERGLHERENQEIVDALANELGLPEYVRQALHASESFSLDVNKSRGVVRVRYAGRAAVGHVTLLQGVAP